MIDTRTSYHEAGHAVMAMALGFTVSEISNLPEGTSQGRMKCASSIHSSDTSRMASILISASGMASEFIYWKNNGADVNVYCAGHWSDLKKAELHLEELGDEGLFDIYCGVAIHFLKQPAVWEWVEFLADSVTQEGEIIREKLTEIADAVPKFGPDEYNLLGLALSHAKCESQTTRKTIFSSR